MYFKNVLKSGVYPSERDFLRYVYLLIRWGQKSYARFVCGSLSLMVDQLAFFYFSAVCHFTYNVCCSVLIPGYTIEHSERGVGGAGGMPPQENFDI